MSTIVSSFRESKPFSQMVGLLFFLILGFLFATGLMVLCPVDMEAVAPGRIRQMLWVQGGQQLLMFLMPACVWAWVYQGNAMRYLKVDMRGRKWLQGLVAMVLLLLLMPINDWVTYWNAAWNLGPLEETMRQMTEQSTRIVGKMLSLTGVGDFALQLLVVALVPALCEEVFFRGCLQQVLGRWFGNGHVAIAVTAIIFSLAHGDIYGFVPRLLLGWLLGYLFYLSGSMVVNVMAHFFNNAVVVIFYYLFHQGHYWADPTASMMIPLATTALCTLAACVLFKMYFVNREEKALNSGKMNRKKTKKK